MLKPAITVVTAFCLLLLVGCGGGSVPQTSAPRVVPTAQALSPSTAARPFTSPRSDGWSVQTDGPTFYFGPTIGMRLRGTLQTGTFQFRSNGKVISVSASRVRSIARLMNGSAHQLSLARFKPSALTTTRSAERQPQYYVDAICTQPIGRSFEDDQWNYLCYCPDGSIADLGGICFYWVDDPIYYYYPAPSYNYATNPETPDDPDGPGHGPQPDMTLPESQACPDGYSLAYSNGDGGNPVGGPYCGVEYKGDPSIVASMFSVNTVIFSTGHYWNRHLACYVHTTYSSSQWNAQIKADFQPRPNPPTTINSVEFTGQSPPTVTDDAGVSTQWGYRVNLLASETALPIGLYIYNVGTSFLVPRRVDCPKPYPAYP